MTKTNCLDDVKYQSLRAAVSSLYSHQLTDQEAFEATQNLIGFTKLLLEIKIRQALESKDAKSI